MRSFDPRYLSVYRRMRGSQPTENCPDDCLGEVVRFLPVCDVVRRFGLVSRRFRLLTLQDHVWRDFYSWKYPLEVEDGEARELAPSAAVVTRAVAA